MKEKIKELDEQIKDRHVTDGDGAINMETLRLMELRVRLEQAEQLETLNRRLVELTQMIRAKF